MLRGTMCLITLAVLSVILAPRLLLNARPAQRAQDQWPKEITNSIGMKLVRIPAGKFTMGSTKEEQDAALRPVKDAFLRELLESGLPSEGPQHEVKITKAFYLGIYTVTQAEYEQVMGKNPSWFCAASGGKDKVKGISTSKFPVETVFWDDAVKFCAKLSALAKEKEAKRAYRLPTEAEWEYACRAGTKTKYYSGDSEDSLKTVAWYSLNSDERTHNVGRKKANKFGLFDMHGNVWQWCSDWADRSTIREALK